MLLYSRQVFDDTVDTSTTWTTSAEFNELLGRADNLLIVVYPTLVSGTSPTFTLAVDTSNDNQHWYETIAGLIVGASLVSGSLLQANQTNNSCAFQRLRFWLSGANAQCQMRIGVVGRSL